MIEDEQKTVVRGAGGRWLPGQSANPSGRPLGARQKIEESFLDSLRRKWAADGDGIVDKAALQDPVAFLNVMAKVLPKELAISVEQRTPGNLDANAYAALRSLLNVIEASKIEGEPGEVFERIEQFLRSENAKQIDSL